MDQAGHSVWATGNAAALGQWNEGKALPMVHTGDRIYVGQLLVKRSDLPLEFKFLIKDAEGQVIPNPKT